MRLSCNREKLWEATANVIRAVSSKSSIAALEGILLRAQGGRLSLTGYDLETGIFTDIEARIAEEGEIVLNAKLFSEIIRSLPEDTLNLAADEKKMTVITSGPAEFNILGFDPSEYPELPGMGETKALGIDAVVLKGMIRQTIFAVAQNDIKPVHTGVLFELGDGKIRLVAVDGFRLALRDEALADAPEMRFIVPGKALTEISRLISDNTENIKIDLGTRHILFELSGYTVISRLLDGDFLDYRRSVPEGYKTQIRLNVRQTAECIERISLLINDRMKSPVRCVLQENKVLVSCVTAAGKANDELAAEIEGELLEIGFNNRYFLDALKNCECDELLLQINGALSPMKLVPCDGDSFLFLVLPVRLKAGT
ncbi:MAG TPA: DNA polymerase III subunit beta [Ruminococcaceae bacterium]|nr:DNA polymerase III subunit beta [Oscillospiraceae bacterium]